MGSMVHLRCGALEIDWGKNYGFADHRTLFQSTDISTASYRYVDDDGSDVVLAPASGVEHPVERRARCGGAADPLVHVLLDDLPASLLGHLAKLIKLETHVLAVAARAHAGVERDPRVRGRGRGGRRRRHDEADTSVLDELLDLPSVPDEPTGQYEQVELGTIREVPE